MAQNPFTGKTFSTIHQPEKYFYKEVSWGMTPETLEPNERLVKNELNCMKSAHAQIMRLVFERGYRYKGRTADIELERVDITNYISDPSSVVGAEGTLCLYVFSPGNVYQGDPDVEILLPLTGWEAFVRVRYQGYDRLEKADESQFIVRSEVAAWAVRSILEDIGESLERGISDRVRADQDTLMWSVRRDSLVSAAPESMKSSLYVLAAWQQVVENVDKYHDPDNEDHPLEAHEPDWRL